VVLLTHGVVQVNSSARLIRWDSSSRGLSLSLQRKQLLSKGVRANIMQPIQRLSRELEVAKQMLIGTLELPCESRPDANPNDDKEEPDRREELVGHSLVAPAFDVRKH